MELARREAELIEEGRWEEVVRLGAQRETLLARLPEPGPEAREELAAALALVDSSAGVAAGALAEVRETLGHLARGRQAISAYARL